MISIKRARVDLPEHNFHYVGGLMLTLGTERFGLRITRGHLSRRAVFHDNWPDVFFLFRGRRVG